MYTRQQYLNHEIDHRQYYTQFVTPAIFNLVSGIFGYNRLKSAFDKDEHFNSIPLQEWDNLTYLFRCDKQLRECGDYATLAGKVCILKEAARQIVDL